jgi:hypothetical protein
MKKFPTRNEIRDMKFSSLACRIHDWIDSMTRSVINKTQKTECAGMITLLEAKLEGEPENVARARVVEKLRRDLESLLTYAEATRRKSAPGARKVGIDV